MILYTLDMRLSPPDEKIDKRVPFDDEMETDALDTEDSYSDLDKKVEMKDMKNSVLINAFQKLYHSYFDGEDVELCDDIFHILDELKARSCVTDREYIHMKSFLI